MLYCVKDLLKAAGYKKLQHQFDEVPDSVLAPYSLSTRIGDFQFNDGTPTQDTVRLLSAYHEFHTYVNATMHCVPIAVYSELKESLSGLGLGKNKVGVFMQGPDSNSLLVSANPSVIYTLSWLDVAQGPLVIEIPPATIGSLLDATLSLVGDISHAGLSSGKGGKYLLVGPDWHGEYDETEYQAVFFSGSYGNCMVLRCFLSVNDAETIMQNLAQRLKIYSLGELPRHATLFNLSGVKFSALPAYDEKMFDQINSVIQNEHPQFISAHVTELLDRVGIIKGKPFLRDMPKNQLLTEAAVVAFATVRTKLYYPEQQSRYLHRERQWFTVASDGFQQATAYNHGSVNHAIAPYVLPIKNCKANFGTQKLYELSCMSVKDSKGNLLHGSKRYRLQIPAAAKAELFWQVTLYDTLHWSMLITDQALPALV
jgi:hypothetical protein